MTAWQDMSKPALITELSRVCRVLEEVRRQARRDTLRLELYEKVQNSTRGEE